MTRHSTLLIPLCLLVLTLRAAAADAEFRFAISAGDHDRRHTPVVVDTPWTETAWATVADADGQSIPALVTPPGLLSAAKNRQLIVVIPRLERGATVTYQAKPSASPPSAGPSFTAAESPRQWLQLARGDRPIERAMVPPYDNTSSVAREASYKVFHHVFDPADGERVVTKGPGGQYTHHRGLFFGFNKVSYHDGQTKCDIWHCRGAHQSFDGLLNTALGSSAGRQTLKIGWHGPDDSLFADETRELTAWSLPEGTLIEFASRVVSHVGEIKLDGDPQHAGFHFRAGNEVAEKTKGQTYYLRPDGQDAPGKTRNWDAKNRDPRAVDLPWNGMSFVLGETRYTALYLDHPRNPKEARYSERDYGRFGSYFEATITTERPLEVNYRVWLQRGEMTVDAARHKSADFVAPPTVQVPAP